MHGDKGKLYGTELAKVTIQRFDSWIAAATFVAA
jgi:hypothetical protein